MDSRKDRGGAEERGEQSMQLLPRLSDEITLDHICTKLPWNAFHVLSSVSHHWLEAIQSRRVYDARIRCNSTDTLVLLDHETLILYSMRENRCYQIPGMLRHAGGFPRCCKFVALDGKIYCLGQHTARKEHTVNEVLDVAGQQQWEPFADMEEPGSSFGCGVLGGRIYVCGGFIAGVVRPASRSEVYDPERNVWSSIAVMKSKRYCHHVTTLGGELFVYAGLYELDPDEHFDDSQDDALFLEVYNPGKDEWRVIEPCRQEFERLFAAQGKLHMMSPSGIHVLDGSVEKNIWTELHSFSIRTVVDFDFQPVLNVDGELLVACYVPDGTGGTKVGLARSKGFGSETKELVWENVNCPLLFSDTLTPPFMCTIQL